MLSKQFFFSFCASFNNVQMWKGHTQKLFMPFYFSFTTAYFRKNTQFTQFSLACVMCMCVYNCGPDTRIYVRISLKNGGKFNS